LKRKEKVGGKEAQQRLVRWIGPAHQQTNNAALQPNLMPSQQNFFSVQTCQIDMSDDCGIRHKDAHELASRQTGGSNNLSYTRIYHKNYLRTKRQKYNIWRSRKYLELFSKESYRKPFFLFSYAARL
jgi:hypothetical protein